jgi:hypothetical protein
LISREGISVFAMSGTRKVTLWLAPAGKYWYQEQLALSSGVARNGRNQLAALASVAEEATLARPQEQRRPDECPDDQSR